MLPLPAHSDESEAAPPSPPSPSDTATTVTGTEDLEQGMIVAQLLKYDSHGHSTAWSKGEFDANHNFTETVKTIIDTVTYPSYYGEFAMNGEMEGFSHYAETKVVPAAILCEELAQAEIRMTALRGSEIRPGYSYYLRKDFSQHRIYNMGDSHGSLHSMCDIFADMKANGAFDNNTGKLNPNVAVVCTGDILDRSPYCLDCLYLMLRLQRENPDVVVLTSGNHESDSRFWDYSYGTGFELEKEYPGNSVCGSLSMREQLKAVTTRLPASLIARTRVGIVQFNHGGIENFLFHALPLKINQAEHAKAQKFLSFAQFTDDPDITTMETRKPIFENPLVWGDMFVDDNPNSSPPRVVISEQTLRTYLTNTGIKLLMRGHSDMANLSLTYRRGTGPSDQLQAENSVDSDVVGANWKYYGSEARDTRTPDNIKRGNSFVFHLKDMQNVEVYDMHTLQLSSHNQESFIKTLYRSSAPDNNLLAVTVSSCPFSKPFGVVQEMSTYVVFT